MRNRYVKRKKKLVLIIILFITLFVLLSILLYFILKKGNKDIIHNVIFNLNGEEIYELEVGSDYIDAGCTATVDNKDKTSEVKVDLTNLDVNKIGKYKIKYYLIIDNKEYKTFREVQVIDKTPPVITLEGSKNITVLLNNEYKELGYIAIDNYDGDITDKVVVENNFDKTKVGEYTITYTSTDTSGNTSTLSRTITVKKPNKIIQPSNTENKETKNELVPSNYSNTITKNKFTNSGIYLEGYLKSSGDGYTIKLVGESEYNFEMTSNGENKYKGNIDLTGVENGNYVVYIASNSSEVLQNKMSFIERLARSKVGDKLVTFNYSEDNVSIKVEDFYYSYDVLIDPGHGGSDVGASNEYIYEKEMNLDVSLYEKCRYENHGLKVYLTRESDTYGNGMGDNSLNRLHRRSYEIGYVGTVTQIVYSNHHNWVGNNTYSGYEILLSGYLTNSQLKEELAIVNKFNSIYPLKENHMRFYARDYDTEKKYSMLNGETYTFKDNYAVNRIPYQIFNTKSIIYEGAYLSNKEDFDWYWNKNNWIKVSEAKIEVYVTSLGKSYNPDNSSCLN